ncbi:hypothetical protein E8E11_005356 [Didymella keratinophila]|nr:hypothetical protein E8E11_005356 [Didymella keratinophila]
MRFMCREMTVNYVRIRTTFSDSSGIRIIVAHPCDARPGEYWCDKPMPTDIIFGAVSFDHCRVAVGLLTPVLAWLLEGLPVGIVGDCYQPKNKAHPVRLHFPYFPKRIPAGLLILVLKPKSDEALVIDPSSMQYRHTVKIHKYTEYAAKYKGEGEQHDNLFGSTYRIVRDGAAAGEEYCISSILAIRELDEAVWQIVENLGGRNRLYTMGHVDFVQARDKIGRRLRDALARFRAEANGPRLDFADWTPER